jgi:hypothetical protein
MWLSILAIWGCIPELAKDCIDMTNSSSTYLGIRGGAAVGAAISCWIYDIQKKTSRTQDNNLRRIESLEEKNTKILAHLETFAKNQESTINKIVHLNESILLLDKKIKSMAGQRN